MSIIADYTTAAELASSTPAWAHRRCQGINEHGERCPHWVPIAELRVWRNGDALLCPDCDRLAAGSERVILALQNERNLAMNATPRTDTDAGLYRDSALSATDRFTARKYADDLCGIPHLTPGLTAGEKWINRATVAAILTCIAFCVWAFWVMGEHAEREYPGGAVPTPIPEVSAPVAAVREEGR